MKTTTFNAICRIVYDACGISLTEKKKPLVTSRLQKRLRILKLETYEDYLRILQENHEGEMVEFLNAISTNTTSFMREPVHFDYYRDVLNKLLENKQRKIRVWCAASSTGEEPYTLAMYFREYVDPGNDIDFKILATDISTRVLKTAHVGIYNKDKLETIPGHLRHKYFSRMEPRSDFYEASESLKKLIMFRRLNLAATPYPLHGPLDIIFCRNVMIYFDSAGKNKLVTEASRLLAPGGYLFVGHSESINEYTGNTLKLVKPATYVKKGF